MTSSLQAKAMYLMLLLAGHETVRIRQKISVHNSTLNPQRRVEDEWQSENEACTWTTTFKCKGPGCGFRYLPCDRPSESCRLTDEHMLKTERAHYFHLQAGLLAAKSAKFSKKCRDASDLKCLRRAMHMFRAMIFLAKAQDSSLMDSLSAEQQDADRVLLQKSLDNIAGMAGSDGAVVQELMQKMRARKSVVMEDPSGTVKHLEVLLTKLLKGSEEEKEQARTEVHEMEIPSKTDEEDLNDSIQEDRRRDYGRILERRASDVLKNLDSVALQVDSEKEAVCVWNGTSMLQLSHSSTKLKLHAIAETEGFGFVMLVSLLILFWIVFGVFGAALAGAFD
jgi:hypothetical protein